MINVLELRARIESALDGLLGTYTFTDGATTDAIAVDYGNNIYPPPGAKAQGLECLILPRPDVPIKSLMGGYEETYSVNILLKQWDETQTTLPAMEQLLNALDNVQPGSIRRVLPIAELNNIETLQMAIAQSFLRPSSRTL